MSSPKWLRRPWRWPLELLLISASITEALAQSNNSSHSCYYPSGIISGGKPCHPNAKNSACCGPGFECLSNGVCQTTPAIDTTFKYSLYRSGCTDPTFQDPACPRFCFGEEDNPQAGQGLQVCSPELGIYCCKRDYDCCTNSTLTYKLGKPEIGTVIPNHTAHPTQSHSPTSTSSHPIVQADTRQSTAYARDTIIGVGAGFAAATAILMLGCCFWLTRRRHPDRDRDQDQKSDALELDTFNSSRLAIHKEISISISQIETPSPLLDLDSTTRLELDTTRGNAINDVVAQFELEASLSDVEGMPDGISAQGATEERSRNDVPWDEIPSPERRAPGIPILEVSPERQGANLVPIESWAPQRPPPQIPGSDLSASEIAASGISSSPRPTSESYAPVAGRVQTPLPTLPFTETSTITPPPLPATAATIAITGEVSAPQRLSLERPLTAPPHSEETSPEGPESGRPSLERPTSHISAPKPDIPELQSPQVPTPNVPAPHAQAPQVPAPERPAPERPAPEKPARPD